MNKYSKTMLGFLENNKKKYYNSTNNKIHLLFTLSDKFDITKCEFKICASSGSK